MADLKYLSMLAREYPNVEAAAAQIINLDAILSLPKGTEYFVSDLHGEHEAFLHMLRSASGTIKNKIDEHFGNELSDEERDSLASLIYNPEAEILRRKLSEDDFDEWCKDVILRLIVICNSVSTKYTRAKVRKSLPEHLGASMDELLHAEDAENKTHYYNEIIRSIIDCEIAEEYIISMATSIGRLAVDRLHIIGDIFDRGPHPDKIMDYLITLNDVDFEWGNHDILWMGAATGNWACITNALRNNIGYNNFDMLEVGYGINLRPLSTFAEQVYGKESCEMYLPKTLDLNEYDPVDLAVAARMNKAITIMMFKVEGQRIKAHPEYGMNDRLLMDKVNWEDCTIEIDGKVHKLKDTYFPTVDPKDPCRLSPEEYQVLEALEASILKSEKLQRHIRFLFDHGALYKIINGNLLYHGCVPMDEKGEFMKVSLNGVTVSGKDLFDYLDKQVRAAYFSPDESEETGRSGDLMWYLWQGKKSPLFGKDKIATFERLLLEDKALHKETQNAYYRHIKRKGPCMKILREFGLGEDSKIINGHVPVKLKDGESPIKGGGKLFVIDGGIAKAYQKTTGIAGYTLVFNSRFIALAEHKPYQPMQPDGTQQFFSPKFHVVEYLPKRMMVRDTDQGAVLQAEMEDMKDLLRAFRRGQIKQSK